MTSQQETGPNTFLRGTAAVSRALGSTWLFWVIVAAFIASALAIALTAKPQLLYDEYYHFGIIGVYSKQLSPFITHQTAATAPLGDLTRMGSFLYHYLLSFPERLAVHAGASLETQFRLLRTITVLMAGASLYWFRRCLTDTGVPSAVANTAIAVYVALPITSFLGATINYDNLLLLLAAMHLSLGVRIYTDRRRSMTFYVMFLATGVLASLTKFEFIPAFIATFVILAVRFVLVRRSQPLERGLPLLPARRPAPIAALVGAAALLVAGIYAVAARYVLNALTYGTPQPDCGDLHAVAFCLKYGPWERNYELGLSHPVATPLNPKVIGQYLPQWITNMLSTIHTDGVQTHVYGGPAAFSSMLSYAVPVAIVILAIGLGFVLRRPGFQFLTIAAAFYLAVLFHAELSYYLRYGQANIISARYVMFFVPIFLGAVGLALSVIVRRLYPVAGSAVNVGIFLLLAVLSLDGGWFTTFMVGANPDWFDPTSPFAPLLTPLRFFSSHVIVQ
ncbi:hypothetical protein [Gryllotalpicola koreensis]|uniref:Glycosyltransferase RgtA/B/C/D-like domain-containing protein n=1 Tax=Gryllotalpicola koreensis TaxID=993086 RepID=A0ABP8A1C5_9MICO